MKLQRTTSLLVEPPSVATGDIAFNLIVFFLVCASVEPDSGRKQNIPRAEQQKDEKQQSDNLQITLTRTSIIVNNKAVLDAEFPLRMRTLLASKKRDEDRVVLVKSSKDTPYDKWIKVTGQIEDAGGTVTLQMEEELTTIIGQ